MPEIARPVAGLTQPEMVRLLINLRAKVYPWMHILARADGSVVVTLSPPPQDGARD